MTETMEPAGGTDGSERAATHPVLRSLSEPALFVGLALVYIWLIQPTDNDAIRVPFVAFTALIPILSVIRRKATLRDLGIRVDNLGASAWEVGALTLLGAALILGVALVGGGEPVLNRGALRLALFYPLWGLAQQFAMQSFSYRRIRQGISQPAAAAALTAGLFALAHLPNWPLTSLTLVGGFFWCRLFERNPNLITLALSHGWLAVLLKQTWPESWLHGLRIGPSYWTWP